MIQVHIFNKTILIIRAFFLLFLSAWSEKLGSTASRGIVGYVENIQINYFPHDIFDISDVILELRNCLDFSPAEQTAILSPTKYTLHIPKTKIIQ